MRKLNERSLAKLRQEEAAAEQARLDQSKAWIKKAFAIALYGGTCVGACGTTAVEEIFLVHIDELLDPDARILHRGKDYRLAARWHVALYDYVVRHEKPKGYAVFCWACFKRIGRQRRRAQGIVNWRSPKAVEGFNTDV